MAARIELNCSRIQMNKITAPDWLALGTSRIQNPQSVLVFTNTFNTCNSFFPFTQSKACHQHDNISIRVLTVPLTLVLSLRRWQTWCHGVIASTRLFQDQDGPWGHSIAHATQFATQKPASERDNTRQVTIVGAYPAPIARTVSKVGTVGTLMHIQQWMECERLSGRAVDLSQNPRFPHFLVVAISARCG